VVVAVVVGVEVNVVVGVVVVVDVGVVVGVVNAHESKVPSYRNAS
jgi:hypothetical protein